MKRAREGERGEQREESEEGEEEESKRRTRPLRVKVLGDQPGSKFSTISSPAARAQSHPTPPARPVAAYIKAHHGIRIVLSAIWM